VTKFRVEQGTRGEVCGSVAAPSAAISTAPVRPGSAFLHGVQDCRAEPGGADVKLHAILDERSARVYRGDATSACQRVHFDGVFAYCTDPECA